MKEKLALGGIIVISIIFIIVTCQDIDIPTKKINLNLVGVKYRLEEESYSQLVEVRIEGKYYNNFLSEKRFEGKIYIDKYVLYSLVLFFDENNSAELQSVSPFQNLKGEIFFDDDFNKMIICFSESVIGDWEIEDNLLISAPASNRDEAIEISKELFNDLSVILD